MQTTADRRRHADDDRSVHGPNWLYLHAADSSGRTHARRLAFGLTILEEEEDDPPLSMLRLPIMQEEDECIISHRKWQMRRRWL
jgi:hypothetical protein